MEDTVKATMKTTTNCCHDVLKNKPVTATTVASDREVRKVSVRVESLSNEYVVYSETKKNHKLKLRCLSSFFLFMFQYFGLYVEYNFLGNVG